MKKKYLKILCLVFLISIMSFSLISCDKKTDDNDIVDKFEYELLDDDTYMLTKYEGNNTIINIPNEYNGKSVTHIGTYAFINNTDITNINIPNTVLSIGDEAFCGCTSLRELEILHGLIQIGDGAFVDCSSLTKITIPNGVINIGDSAFLRCSSLAKITIPSSVINIGSNPFSGCSNLENIEVDSKNQIYKSEGNCLLTKDGEDLIVGCKSSVIPSSVIRIEPLAFRGCSNLTKITIPSSVINIGSNPFSGCSNLENIEVDSKNQIYKSEGNCLLTKDGRKLLVGCKNSVISSSVVSIGDFAFELCSLTSLKIPEGVTNIGNNAFSGCSNLENIEVDSKNQIYKSEGNCLLSKDGEDLLVGCKNSVIPSSVKNISGDAFCECSSLTNITIPSSVTYIDSYAFSRCNNLTNIIIPSSVKNIGNNAFIGCSNLENIEVNQNNKTYKSEGNCILTKDGRKLLVGCKNSVIPSSVKNISEDAFCGCSNLTNIIIPDSVTGIGDSAFYGCSSLIAVDVPSSVTSIGDSAFYGCSSLIAVDIPNSVTSIGDSAFGECSNLTRINIPKNVTSIGKCVFIGCRNLINIEVNPNNKTYKSEGNCILTKDGRKLLVGCKNGVIPSSVVSIEDFAFGCCSLTSIKIPEGVTNIGNRAFLFNNNLTNIVIPHSVISIGEGAFILCNRLDIKCEVTKQPSGWHENWNPNNRPVQWGYSG